VTRHSPKPTTSLLIVVTAAGLGLLVTLDARSQPAAVPAKADIAWLEERSMLRQAGEAARGVSGKNVQWQHRYDEVGPPRQDGPRPAPQVDRPSSRPAGGTYPVIGTRGTAHRAHNVCRP
jgi:hypothetical protein